MFVAKEGLYLESDLQNDCFDSAKLIFISSENLWGDLYGVRKLKGIPMEVAVELSAFCKGGRQQVSLYTTPDTLGDESGHYVCHLYNDDVKNLIVDYFDSSTLDFERVDGRYLIPDYNSYSHYRLSDLKDSSEIKRSMGHLLDYCEKCNIADVFIAGGNGAEPSFDAYVVKNYSAIRSIGVGKGDYSLICMQKGIPLLEELKFPARSKYAVYSKYSVIYDDEVSDLL